MSVFYANRPKRAFAQLDNFSGGCNSRLLIAETVLKVVMSTMKPHSAKIIHHSAGLGAPTAETVRLRAQELARINGRPEFNDEDWREAKRELHGGHTMNDTNGDLDMTAMVSEHDMVTGSMGHHVENMGLDDNDNIVEELIAEGMDEAVHEQMLASRQEDESEREDEDEE